MLHTLMHNDHRRAETITIVFFPSGPSRRCSTSHSRQCPGTLPAGGSQSMFSVSGPARTYTLSVVGGFTGNTVVKTMAGLFSIDAGERVGVPWFWICREMNCCCRGPSGEEPFTQRLMSVKRGSDVPVNLQPLLMPLEMM